MTLIAKSSGGVDFEIADEGTHLAICTKMIDLGTQHDPIWNKYKLLVLIGWELPNEKREDGEPMIQWQRYTNSLHEKATLRIHLENWRGRRFTDAELEGFNLANIIGAPCYLSIMHNKKGDKTYANVGGIMSVPKGVEIPEHKSEAICFDIDRFNEPAMQEVFKTFSENLQNTIKAAKELQAKPQSNGQQQQDTGDYHEVISEDDIPF